MTPTLAVVGAGWAGMAAAVEAATRGADVVVFEATRSLGGRARGLDVAGPDGAALRLEDQTRTEVADRHGMSLRRVDTVLRQALDYCAQACGETVRVGVSGPRRALPRRWRRQAEAGLLPASPHAAAARPRGVARLASR